MSPYIDISHYPSKILHIDISDKYKALNSITWCIYFNAEFWVNDPTATCLAWIDMFGKFCIWSSCPMHYGTCSHCNNSYTGSEQRQTMLPPSMQYALRNPWLHQCCLDIQQAVNYIQPCASQASPILCTSKIHHWRRLRGSDTHLVIHDKKTPTKSHH